MPYKFQLRCKVIDKDWADKKSCCRKSNPCGKCQIASEIRSKEGVDRPVIELIKTGVIKGSREEPQTYSRPRGQQDREVKSAAESEKGETWGKGIVCTVATLHFYLKLYGLRCGTAREGP